MSAKYYLDQEGLERLVDYINNGLSGKVSKGEQVVLPEDLVREADLADYAKKSDIPEGQDLSGYAKTTDLADYALASSLSNYAPVSALDDYAEKAALEDYATNADLEALKGKVTGVYHFKGNVANLEALQAIENPQEGDVYNIQDTGINAAWVVALDSDNGGYWDEFGTTVDLSPYAKSEDIQSMTIPQVDAILYGGSSAVVNDTAGLMAMISNDEPEVTVVLKDDLAVSGAISVPTGKKVNLDLGGNTLSASAVALNVAGGEAVISNGNIASSNSDAIAVSSGGTLVVDGANVTSSSRNAISAREASIVVNSGNVTSQEAGLLGLKNSNITINGGTITGIDNGPVMGNGSAAGSANDGTNMNVVMNGGKLVAHIQSAGYVACGVYVPNTGSFTMNGGEIESDGAGIVMRGGTVNLNGGVINANGTSGVKGKVGDSRIVVGPYAVVYDQTAHYPAVDSMELNIGKDMVLNGTDGDISVLVDDGVTANITDNREETQTLPGE